MNKANPPTFSKRHLEYLATILLEMRDNPSLSYFHEPDSPFWRTLYIHVAVRLVATNSRFDIYKFMSACDQSSVKTTIPTHSESSSVFTGLTKNKKAWVKLRR